DGSRTLIMWHDLFARNLQYTVVLRAAANFRPLEAFTSYWSPGGFKGTTLITVNGDTVDMESHGPLGTFTQTVKVPEKLSLGTHPVSGDGWHTWYDDPKAKGVQKSGMTYGLDPGGDMSRPVVGLLVPQQFENLGKEKITVRAGTFDTVHYKVAGASDTWVLMPDRILIKMSMKSRGIDYELVEFASGDNSEAR
ncbi:MAG: hypothetical protein KDE14_09955, partial [Rhodobacteraceae bacterium]|nr:hypothetical protein [Paracoccaceae bacterium]